MPLRDLDNLSRELDGRLSVDADVWEQIVYNRCVERKGFVDRGYLDQEELQRLDLNYLEVLVYKLPDGTQVFSRVGLLTTDENKPRRPKKVPKDKLEDWIRQKGDYKPGALPSRYKDAELIGGIRLLYQQWPRPRPKKKTPAVKEEKTLPSKESSYVYEKDFDWRQYEPHPASGEHIPFSHDWPPSFYVLLGIPKSYPCDLTGRVAVPLRIKKAKNKLNFVVQSPRYPNHSFITTAGSYNFETKVTSGYLAYIYDEGHGNDSAEGHMHNVLRALNDLSSLTTHPLLIPALIVEHWCDYYDSELDASADRLKDAQAQIKSIERELRRPLNVGGQNYSHDHDPKTRTQKETLYEDTHAQLVNLQGALLRESFAFINSLSRSCLDSLAIIGAYPEAEIGSTGGPELQTILRHLCGTVYSDGQRRDRLIKQMDASFQQLYNNTQFLVQQGDAKVNQSNNQQMRIDSAAVKRISVVTMLFLPGTLVATIFGMLPFFSNEDEAFRVSKDFWIFWAWTIPLTILVIVLWFVNITYHPFHWIKELLWYIVINIDPNLGQKYRAAYPASQKSFFKPHLRPFLEDNVPKPEDKSIFGSIPWPTWRSLLGVNLPRRNGDLPSDVEANVGEDQGSRTDSRSRGASDPSTTESIETGMGTMDEKGVVIDGGDEPTKVKKRWRFWT